ncbi:uncharacterized protein PV07_12850 [Cladophialophora immunda]|uniref:Uncharacterized protein n=1 Tax=Cladophialophora immunda TaxID=569365 RepID=A0A0D2BRL2_9EURO|nr:uncharacterized protein PV07_12850 [Cladophialophora immunda]KIW21718.1 hypothetical protein PV07_12850 [Cladophialophora immunda]
MAVDFHFHETDFQHPEASDLIRTKQVEELFEQGHGPQFRQWKARCLLRKMNEEVCIISARTFSGVLPQVQHEILKLKANSGGGSGHDSWRDIKDPTESNP